MVRNLRNKIKILNYSSVENGRGGFIKTPRVDKEVWANIIPTSGVRGLDGSQISLNQTYDVIIRFEDYSGLSKRNSFQFENRVLVIHSIQIIDERRKYIKAKCEEDANRDVILLDEQFRYVTDENGNLIYE